MTTRDATPCVETRLLHLLIAARFVFTLLSCFHRISVPPPSSYLIALLSSLLFVSLFSLFAPAACSLAPALNTYALPFPALCICICSRSRFSLVCSPTGRVCWHLLCVVRTIYLAYLTSIVLIPPGFCLLRCCRVIPAY